MSRDDLCKKICTAVGLGLYTETTVKVENLGAVSQNGDGTDRGRPRRTVTATVDTDELRRATRRQHADDLIDDRVDDAVVDSGCNVGDELRS